MPPDREGMIFVFTGFAERRTGPFEPHVSKGVGGLKKIWVQPPFSAKNRTCVGCACSMLYRASAFRIAKHEFNAHPPFTGRREMGSGTAAFNPRDPHGPYAPRSYPTARESGTTHRMSGSRAGCQARHGEGSAGISLLSRYFYLLQQ
jgi:hypothetical protein